MTAEKNPKGQYSEQGPSYYDEVYRGQLYQSATNLKGMTWYPVWKAAASWLLGAGTGRVLDVGCGPGLVARVLMSFYGKEPLQYVGWDFSPEAIRLATDTVKDERFTFCLCDARQEPDQMWQGYDAYLMTEVLEHLDHDMELLSSVPLRKKVFLSVPTRWSNSHVRVFKTEGQVESRYGGLVNFDVIQSVSKRHIIAHGSRIA